MNVSAFVVFALGAKAAISALPVAVNIPGFVDLKVNRGYDCSDGFDRLISLSKSAPPSGRWCNDFAWLLPMQNTGVNVQRDIFNLYSSYHNEYMLSPSAYEGSPSYVNPFNVAYFKPFANNFGYGVSPLVRWVKNGTYNGAWRMDHVTVSSDNDLAKDGYSREGEIGYAWKSRKWDPNTGSMLVIRPADQRVNAEVGFSEPWGGAVASIKFNGFEYVNRRDPGRLVQSAMFYAGSYTNPTEAGDGFDLTGDASNGSPLISSSKSSTAYSSTVLPILFNNPDWSTSGSPPIRSDITADAPVISGDVIAKTYSFNALLTDSKVAVIDHEVRFTTARNSADIRAFSYQYDGSGKILQDPSSNLSVQTLFMALNEATVQRAVIFRWKNNKWNQLCSIDESVIIGTCGETWQEYYAQILDQSPFLLIAYSSDKTRGIAIYDRPEFNTDQPATYLIGRNVSQKQSGPTGFNLLNLMKNAWNINPVKNGTLKYDERIILGAYDDIVAKATLMASSGQ